MVNFRMDGGTVGRLWTSSVAIGRQHGLTLQVFGETGGLRWSQEQPNQLFYMPLGQRLQVIERGEGNLSPEADRASRVTVGHAEGMPLAFGNIYRDLAESLFAAAEQPRARSGDVAVSRRPRMACGRSRRSMPRWHRPRQRALGSMRGRSCSARAQRPSACHARRCGTGKAEPRVRTRGRRSLTRSDRWHDRTMASNGWWMVVRSILAQPAISISFSPMMPISPGTAIPASRNADSAPIDSTSSPQK